MSTSVRCLAIALLLASTVAIGCKKEASAPTTADKPANQEPAAVDEKAQVAAAVAAELEKLPAAERELVAAQKYCPVTSELLGSMGAPMKVTVEGKDLYICCEGCKEPLEKDFAKYLAMFESKEPSDDNPFD